MFSYWEDLVFFRLRAWSPPQECEYSCIYFVSWLVNISQTEVQPSKTELLLMLSRLSVSGLWCLNGCDITENHSGPIKRLITVIRCISSVQYNYNLETPGLTLSDWGWSWGCHNPHQFNLQQVSEGVWRGELDTYYLLAVMMMFALHCW